MNPNTLEGYRGVQAQDALSGYFDDYTPLSEWRQWGDTWTRVVRVDIEGQTVDATFTVQFTGPSIRDFWMT